MGQALYRKYRTTTLDETVGQEHITHTLANAIKHGKISHAYLFTGPRGVGKTSVARILAHDVNGLPYDSDANHLDIIEIDAASNRRIDEIRDLRDRVHIAPTSAKYKVYIIDEVHMLTKEAFNALLKTLEEPPAHVIFILATTESHKLPETIISRTQRYIFRPIDESTVVKRLRYIANTEQINIDDAALSLIAVAGGGSFRDSISLLDQVANLGDTISAKEVRQALGIAPQTALEQLVQALQAHDPRAVSQTIEELRDAGFQSGQIAKQLIAYLRGFSANGNIQADTISLMTALIEVPTAQDVDTKLDIVLLGHSLAGNPSPAPVHTPATPVRTSAPSTSPAAPTSMQSHTKTAAPVDTSSSEAPEIIAPDTPSTPAVAKASAKPTASPKPTVTDQPTADHIGVQEAWPAILQAIKAKNNALYSVARMAAPELVNDQLVLNVSFAFHQKRLNEAANKQIISGIITDITGQKLSIDAQLQSKSEVSAKTPAHATQAPSINTVSNPLDTIQSIFGDAEVLPE